MHIPQPVYGLGKKVTNAVGGYISQNFMGGDYDRIRGELADEKRGEVERNRESRANQRKLYGY